MKPGLLKPNMYLCMRAFVLFMEIAIFYSDLCAGGFQYVALRVRCYKWSFHLGLYDSGRWSFVKSVWKKKPGWRTFLPILDFSLHVPFISICTPIHYKTKHGQRMQYVVLQVQIYTYHFSVPLYYIYKELLNLAPLLSHS